jgi:hypothetical protein
MPLTRGHSPDDALALLAIRCALWRSRISAPTAQYATPDSGASADAQTSL